MKDLYLKTLTPYKLGETELKEAIPYLVEFLKTGTTNEQRLAASAISKLAKKNIGETKNAIPYLLNNLLYFAPQTRQYSLRALQFLPLDFNSISNIEKVAKTDDKEYNHKLAIKILNNNKKQFPRTFDNTKSDNNSTCKTVLLATNGVGKNTIINQLHNEQEIKEQIKQNIVKWRKEKSKILEIPAYCIFSNKTLNAIVDSKPTNSLELLGINGVGEKIIEQYGDEIINI